VKNAKAMAGTFIERGIDIVSGGTENHLMLVNLVGKSYTGKDADEALGLANITVNKNAVPNDPRSPFVTSGLRVGTPAVTTRGFGEADCVQLTHWICDVLDALESGNADRVIEEVEAKVLEICAKYPVYG
jgi:glycine hydroxymethyltransferase